MLGLLYRAKSVTVRYIQEYEIDNPVDDTQPNFIMLGGVLVGTTGNVHLYDAQRFKEWRGRSRVCVCPVERKQWLVLLAFFLFGGKGHRHFSIGDYEYGVGSWWVAR